jgi:chemotaxis protein MotB
VLSESSEAREVPVPTTPSNSEIEQDKMSEVKKLLDSEIAKSGYSDKVKTSLNGEGLEIYIQDAVLFNSGDDKVLTDISPLLLQVSKMLQRLDNNIKVVGHTDTMPISNGRFRSNWDLSAMRAINVMSFLVDTGGLSASRFSVQGYGEQLPKYSNSTEEGRSKNRRVEIFVVRKYPSTVEKTTKVN